LIYSDGITEAMDGAENEFGEQNVIQTVSEKMGLSATELIDKIISAVKNHAGNQPQMDDMTMVVIKKNTGMRYILLSFLPLSPDYLNNSTQYFFFRIPAFGKYEQYLKKFHLKSPKIKLNYKGLQY